MLVRIPLIHPQITFHPIAFLKVDQLETRYRISPCLRHDRSFLPPLSSWRRHFSVPRAPPDNQSWPLQGPSTIQDIVATLRLWQPLGQEMCVSKCPCERARGPEGRLKFQIPVQMRKGYARSLGRGRSEADDGSSSRHLGQCADALRCRPANCLNHGRVM